MDRVLLRFTVDHPALEAWMPTILWGLSATIVGALSALDIWAIAFGSSFSDGSIRPRRSSWRLAS